MNKLTCNKVTNNDDAYYLVFIYSLNLTRSLKFLSCPIKEIEKSVILKM